MKDNWLYRSIMGAEPTPAHQIPKVPIIDDPQPLSVTKRSPETERLIRQLETERAIIAIFGDTLNLAKNLADSPGEPSTTTYNSPPHFSLPKPVADPRRRQCNCPCNFCQSGSGCRNCEATPRCEFSHLGVLSEILPVDPKEGMKLRAAAMSQQQDRMAKSRIAHHHDNLEPLVADFKAALAPHGERIPSKLWESLTTAMASAIATGLPTI